MCCSSLVLAAQDGDYNYSVTAGEVRITKSSGAVGNLTSSAKDITGFKVPAQVGNSTINTTRHTITFHMQYGTSVTGLAPTITLSKGATVSPESGAAQDFTNPISYTVTAENQTSQTWTVTCIIDPNSANDITGFTVPAQVGSSTINKTSHSVTFHMPYGTSVNNLAPTISVSPEATVSPLSGVNQNFTQPITYTVKAQNGTKQAWKVTCIVDPNSTNDITAFTVPNQVGSSAIDAESHTVTFQVLYGTNVKSLSPTIILSAGATITPRSKSPQNFTDPVSYMVKAQNGTIQNWTASCMVDSVSSANDITGFTVSKQVGSSQIDLTSHTITLLMPFGTSLTSIAPTITVSPGATISPGSKAAQNFAKPVTYKVTAQDGTIQDWLVTILNQPKVHVTTVSAISSSSIKVLFNQAPANTSKVSFSIKYSGNPISTYAAWNKAKTEATLTYGYGYGNNFPAGDYTVAVMNDTTDLGTYSVTITSQRIGKISIDSKVLGVTDAGKMGYLEYHVYDQYGVDITTSYLAGIGDIQWQCTVGLASENGKGLLSIIPFDSTTLLTQFKTAVVSAKTLWQTIPASTSVTLNIAQGTISDIKLSKLTSANKAIPRVGDDYEYYIDYTAKDMAGNVTNNLTLVEKGLITDHDNDNPASDYALVSSNPTLVTAKIVPDPNNYEKAVIEVTINDPVDYYLSQDQSIKIAAKTCTGKTSTLTFKLLRKLELDKFTLIKPSVPIASGETGCEIPFAATDQDGNPLTRYSDLVGRVTFSPDKTIRPDQTGLYLYENLDGTASLKYDAPALSNSATTGITETLSSVVSNTWKKSSISINVGLPKKVDSLKIDNSVVIPKMEIGAVQKLDFGFNDGGLQVFDQYGRVIDMIGNYIFNGNSYYVKATVPDNTVVKIDSDSAVAYAGHEIILQGVAPGTVAVKFELMQTSEATGDTNGTGITKSLSVSVLDDKDISGYVLDPVPKPIFANADPGAATDQQADFDSVTEPCVYGTTKSGSKVVLNAANITNRTSSSDDFYVKADDTNPLKTIVIANKLADGMTGSSTTISITVRNSADNRPHTATTNVTSSMDYAEAQSVGFTCQTIDRLDCITATGITSDGNTVTVDLAGKQAYYTDVSENFAAIGGTDPTSILNAIAGRDLTRFTEFTGSGNNRGYVYLWAKDQYGSKAMNLANVMVADCSESDDIPLATVDNNYALMFNYMPTASDYIVIAAVSQNGLVIAIRINFK